MIDCPLCRCEMRVCVERGIELDICNSCNGVWLDAGGEKRGEKRGRGRKGVGSL